MNSDRDPDRDVNTSESSDSGAVGAGLGVIGGGAAGAAIGTAIAGPLGTLVGAIIGAVSGGAAGKAIGDAVDPDAGDQHWAESYKNEPYVKPGHTYDDLKPAYHTGFKSYDKFESGTRFEDAEPHLREEYESSAYAEAGSAGSGSAGLSTSGTGLTGAAGMSIAESGTARRSEKAVDTGNTEVTSTTRHHETTAANLAAKAKLPWDEAKHAAKAAWNRVERGEAVRVPISEEQVQVGKREVEAGSVRLRKVVKTEVVNQPVELRREEVVVERVSSDTPGAIPESAFTEGEIVVPVKREEAIIEKTAHVTGVINVNKTKTSETEQVSETVRREDVQVERDGKVVTTETEVEKRS